jgi:glycosyltransferase involved in cell wall biosynthesis
MTGNTKFNAIMKILHIINELSEGGAATFLMALLPELVKAGHEIELLSLSKPQSDYAQRMRAHGVKVYDGKYGNPRSPHNILLIRSFLHKGEYDIVHTHLFPTQYYAVFAKILSQSKAKFITTEHTTWNKRRSLQILRIPESFIYSQYHKVIGCSEDAAVCLQKWLRRSGSPQFTFVNNGIDLQKFRNAEPYSRQELTLPSDARIVIMTARFFSQKNQLCLVRAAPLLPDDVHILFVGSGEPMNDCKALAQQLGAAARVHFLGRRTDVERLLKSSDIAVLSTHYEGMPISVIEYMAAGVPVVVSDVDGLQIHKGYAVFCTPDDPRAMADAIRRLLDDSAYYQQIARRCLARSQDFSQEKMAQEYLAEYEGLFG